MASNGTEDVSRPSKVLSKLRDVISKLSITRRAREKLEEWEKDSTSINILITGKTGTGKSKLINSIVGKEIAKVGKKLVPETSKVTTHKDCIEDVTVTIWDSPGLQDGTSHEAEYLQDLEKECSKADLLIYCIQMFETRLLPASKDVNAMKKLTMTLGADIWLNTVIVLTFANDIVEFAELNCDTPEEQNAYFSEKLSEWTSVIHNLLRSEIRLSSDLVTTIPVVPAAIPQVPELPDSKSENGKCYWLSELWLQTLAATKLEAKPALIKINAHRMKTVPKEYAGKKVASRSTLIDSIPLTFSEKGAEFGQLRLGRFGKAIGGALGYSLGVQTSLCLLLDIANKASKIENDEYVLV